jgi:hypothetical protein
MIVLTLHRDEPLSREERAELPPGCYPVMSTDDVIARAELDLPVAHMIRFAVEMARAVPDADLEAQERPSASGGAVLRAGALTDPYRTWMPALLRLRLPSAAALSTMPVTPVIDPGAIPAPPEESEPAEPPASREPVPEPPVTGIPTRAIAAPEMPPELASFMDTLLSAPVVKTGGTTSTPAPPAPPTPLTPPAPDAPASGPDPWALLRRGKIKEAEEAFAGHTLDEAGRERVRELLSSSEPASVARGCRISRITGWKASTAMIGRVLYSNDPAVRMEAVRALGVLAGSSMEPALHMLRRDAAPDVRHAAQRAISQIQRRST